jgi:hypothetical protein
MQPSSLCVHPVTLSAGPSLRDTSQRVAPGRDEFAQRHDERITVAFGTCGDDMLARVLHVERLPFLVLSCGLHGAGALVDGCFF